MDRTTTCHALYLASVTGVGRSKLVKGRRTIKENPQSTIPIGGRYKSNKRGPVRQVRRSMELIYDVSASFFLAASRARSLLETHTRKFSKAVALCDSADAIAQPISMAQQVSYAIVLSDETRLL
jgi:hypothetical protein